jgi:peptide/nickel transport system ATP-binding protein/oligopeptide transport system ATP-binding protein
VVAEAADAVAVMYAGRLVEQARVAALFDDPQHPYTLGLLGSIPRLGETQQRLLAIDGTVPPMGAMPDGCRFNPRCVFAAERCRADAPALREIETDHRVACHHAPVEALV